MTFSDEVLMAYADGELDAELRARVTQAIATDPELARRVAGHAALRDLLSARFNTVLDEAVPEHLIAAAKRSEAVQPSANVVPLRRPRSPRTLPRWVALAASFVLGVVVWQLVARLHASGPIVERKGQLLAAGVLDQALSNQLARNQAARLPVQIGVSFLSKQGDYCRTFELRDRSELAGLACNDGAKWTLKALTQIESGPQKSSGYRQAASPLPASIVQAVNDSISGAPLDAHGEAAARAKKWRADR